MYLLSFVTVLAGCGGYAPVAPAPVQAPVVSQPPRPAPPPRARALGSPAAGPSALGLDYKYGGKSPVTGFDCSGLVAHIYREAWGIQLPLTSKGRARSACPCSLAELQAGDLVFYDTLEAAFSHVGIYLGDGKFVHAPKTGAQVRVESVKSSYWAQRLTARGGSNRLFDPH